MDGIYEKLITQLCQEKLNKIGSDYFIESTKIESNEAALYLSRFLNHLIRIALESIHADQEDRIKKQIEFSNNLILWIRDYLNNSQISENLIDTKGQILKAIFSKNNPISYDFKSHLQRVFPVTGLSQSELFTGSNVGISLESEIKKEILSADEIWWLVSFVKWTGIRIFVDVLKEAAQSGKRLRIITTSYMGATDQKAVDFLAELPNTEVKLSYNTDRERLHAKAYLFLRNTGFDTGYIGSSNISRSAMTNGLEWNLKVTTEEIPHIISKFKSTFETYWASDEFELYHSSDEMHRTRLKESLQKERGTRNNLESQFFFDIEPHAYQKAILESLLVEREIHHRHRNLIVAATGTGKTVISAFDFKRFYKVNPSAKLLFVAHREEILIQARSTFRAILREHSFGELWVGEYEPAHFNHLFMSIQTLNNQIDTLMLSPAFFDFIIIDEVHHIAADSYRPILHRFTPKILLGLTATPERLDGTDIREDFCGTIAAELRLPEAINQRYLCPFQYFGISDSIDLSQVQWVRGRYLPSELTKIYMANDHRVDQIIRNLEDIVGNINSIKALAFCVSQDHAEFMAEKFLLKGIKSAVLTSINSKDRRVLRDQLVCGSINVLFVVDIFNEGVDIPEVDTVLFLRPTESLTIFLQQLGRGLRLSQGKDCLTVLDFVGNAHAEYDFSQKFRALIGKSHLSITGEVENDFPHLPLGCSIVLQKEAKEVILQNIKNAIVNQRRLLSLIQGYSHQTTLPLTISNFLNLHPNVTIDDIYRNKIDGGGGWSRLCIKAGLLADSLDTIIEQAQFRAISNRFLQCTSFSYLLFIRNLLNNNGVWDSTNPIYNQFAMMAHFDFWQKPGNEVGFATLEESLRAIPRDYQLKNECCDIIDLYLNSLDIKEIPMDVGFPSALMMHARYTRDEILSAFGENQFDKKSSSREGVVEIKKLNCELLFVTLQKTEKKFSPTTLYQDYAISEFLFHWQTQNAARPDRGRGLSYVNHRNYGKKIILFVREKSSDEFGRAMGFVNVGPVNLESHCGSQPMNITWRLEEPIPPYLWNDAAKLAIA